MNKRCVEYKGVVLDPNSKAFELLDAYNKERNETTRKAIKKELDDLMADCLKIYHRYISR